MRNNTNDAAIVGSLRQRGSHKGRLSDLRTPGLLARWPLIGLVMVLLGSVAFGAMVVNLQSNGPLIPVDLSVANSVHAAALQSSPLIRDVMIFGFYLGQHIIVVIGVLLAIYFVYKRFWPELCMVVIAWAGEGAIWLYLSTYFNRPRPAFAVPVWHTMTAPGFPSGHVIAAAMCFGFLVYLSIPHMRSRLSKVLVIVAAVLIVLYIGFSRIFIGDHYLTDVLAGYALGIAWFGLVFTSVELISRKGMSRHEQKR